MKNKTASLLLTIAVLLTAARSSAAQRPPSVIIITAQNPTLAPTGRAFFDAYLNEQWGTFVCQLSGEWPSYNPIDVDNAGWLDLRRNTYVGSPSTGSVRENNPSREGTGCSGGCTSNVCAKYTTEWNASALDSAQSATPRIVFFRRGASHLRVCTLAGNNAVNCINVPYGLSADTYYNGVLGYAPERSTAQSGGGRQIRIKNACVIAQHVVAGGQVGMHAGCAPPAGELLYSVPGCHAWSIIHAFVPDKTAVTILPSGAGGGNDYASFEIDGNSLPVRYNTAGLIPGNGTVVLPEAFGVPQVGGCQQNGQPVACQLHFGTAPVYTSATRQLPSDWATPSLNDFYYPSGRGAFVQATLAAPDGSTEVVSLNQGGDVTIPLLQGTSVLSLSVTLPPVTCIGLSQPNARFILATRTGYSEHTVSQDVCGKRVRIDIPQSVLQQSASSGSPLYVRGLLMKEVNGVYMHTLDSGAVHSETRIGYLDPNFMGSAWSKGTIATISHVLVKSDTNSGGWSWNIRVLGPHIRHVGDVFQFSIRFIPVSASVTVSNPPGFGFRVASRFGESTVYSHEQIPIILPTDHQIMATALYRPPVVTATVTVTSNNQVQNFGPFLPESVSARIASTIGINNAHRIFTDNRTWYSFSPQQAYFPYPTRYKGYLPWDERDASSSPFVIGYNNKCGASNCLHLDNLSPRMYPYTIQSRARFNIQITIDGTTVNLSFEKELPAVSGSIPVVPEQYQR